MNRPREQERVGAAMEERRNPQEVAAARQPELQGASLAIRDEQSYWTLRQLSALHAMGIKESVSTADLGVFLHYCHRTRLDPFTRQIYLIERRTWNPALGDRGGYEYRQTIQTGIDGFRVIRDRAAAARSEVVEYEDTIWYDRDGGEHTVWLEAEAPAACKVVVLVWGKNATRPRRFPAVLRTASYMATNSKGEPQANWKTQADHMIEKCCEAFGLRRAYPQDLGGLYIEEEMQGNDGGPRDGRPPRITAKPADDGVWVPEPEPPAEPPAADDDPDQSPEAVRMRALARVHALFGEVGLAGDDNRQVRHDVLGALLMPADSRGLNPVEVFNTGDLNTEPLEKAGTALARLIEEARDRSGDPEAGLRGIAERFRNAVERNEAARQRKARRRPAAQEAT
jgi:phage recombination protein Bet